MGYRGLRASQNHARGAPRPLDGRQTFFFSTVWNPSVSEVAGLEGSSEALRSSTALDLHDGLGAGSSVFGGPLLCHVSSVLVGAGEAVLSGGCGGCCWTRAAEYAPGLYLAVTGAGLSERGGVEGLVPCGVDLRQGVGEFDGGRLLAAALRSALRRSASSSRCRCRAAFLSSSSRSLRRCSIRAARFSSSSFFLASAAASSASFSRRIRSSSARRSANARLTFGSKTMIYTKTHLLRVSLLPLLARGASALRPLFGRLPPREPF